ncbi:helix-turn-helix domain-containing protein [uncultured Rhodoblastus sp.]|uniref:winged helix-turn-helix transcriptional regulator n=1 Tax=uncultured Rhodoblastus sp. TaxID=543037 RepID=UPI0025FA7BDC|nr:helix-turn-helix domain-containing protein [uncultured Rhodoblastus sp.]
MDDSQRSTSSPSPEPEIMGARCPVRRVLRVIGDKWTPVVLYCLAGGVLRFGDFQRRIPDISRKMLTQVLRELEAAGLVERTAYPVSPPRTEYRLTDTGRRLHEPTAMLCRWAHENMALLEEIEAARNA